MNDEFLDALVAFDEALLHGRALPSEAPPGLSEELRRQLRESQDCLRLLEASHPRHKPPASVAHFEIRHELGRGTFGVVYLAFDTQLKREVALKLPRPDRGVTPEVCRQFVREGQTIARLDHPNVVAVYGAAEVDGTAYIASAYCSGPSLADWLARHGPPAPHVAAELVARLADGVAHAHACGVLHRDLKPSNVLLADQSLDTPRVADFGTARLLDVRKGETSRGDTQGTPRYMSPEQIDRRRARPGPAADVWALGAILHELLVGRPPYDNEDTLSTLAQILDDTPVPSLRRFRSGIDADLEAVCLKCLDKDSRRRYGSADELARDLRCWAGGRATAAQPLGLAGQAWRSLRRRRALAAVTALLAVALTLLLLSWVWYHNSLKEAHALGRYQKLLLRLRDRAARPSPGWTWDNLADLKEAAALAPEGDRLALRNAAAAALGTADLRPCGEVAVGLFPHAIAYDSRGRWLALGQNFRGDNQPEVEVWLVEPRAGVVVHKLKVPPCPSWEARTGRRDGVRGLAFSPDGRWLAAGSRGGRLHRWDLSQATPERTTWPGHSDGLNAVVFGSDGAALYTTSHDQTARRWDVARGWRLAGECTVGQPESGIAVGPEGRWAVTTDGTSLRRWSSDLLPLVKEPVATQRVTRQLALSPDGRTLAYAYNTRVTLTDAETWDAHTPTHAIPGGFDNARPVEALAFSPDGGFLAAASREDGVVKLWQIADGTLAAELPPGDGAVIPAFSPDGRFLAVTGRDRTRLYEIRHGAVQSFECVQPCVVRSLSLARDGRSVAWLSERGPGAYWSFGHEFAWAPLDHPGLDRTLRHWHSHGNDSTSQIVLHPRGTGIAAVNNGDHLHLWQPWLGGPPQMQEARGYNSVSFGHDGTLWSTAHAGLNFHAFPGRTTPPGSSEKWTSIHSAPETVVCVKAGARYVVAGHQSGSLVVADARSKAEITTRRLVDVPLTAVALGPEETVAAVGFHDGRIVMVHLPDGAVLGDAGAHRDRIVGLAFAGPDLVVSASDDCTVKMWRRSGSRLEELVTLKTLGRIHGLDLADDRVTLAIVVRGERAARIWRLDRLEQQLAACGLGAGLPGRADVEPVEMPRPYLTAATSAQGLKAELYDRPSFERKVSTRYDDQIDFDWTGKSPDPGLIDQHYSIRWTGWVQAPEAGTYRLHLRYDDGVRLWVDEKLRVDDWKPALGGSKPAEATADVDLTEGPHALRMEYFQATGGACVQLSWSRPGKFERRLVPKESLFHTHPGAERAGR